MFVGRSALRPLKGSFLGGCPTTAKFHDEVSDVLPSFRSQTTRSLSDVYSFCYSVYFLSVLYFVRSILRFELTVSSSNRVNSSCKQPRARSAQPIQCRCCK